jgi:glycosyltransferase involved in cell wall biosynthesis
VLAVIQRRSSESMSKRQALVCAPRIPQPDRESGSRRIGDLIDFLRDAGWRITFVARETTGAEHYARHLQQRGVEVYQDCPLDQVVAPNRFDLALLAFWDLAETHLPVVRRLAPQTRVVVDSVDLHFVRNARRLFLTSNGQAGSGLVDAPFAAALMRELNTYAAADAVLTVSRKETDLVNDLTGTAELAHVVPDCEDLPLSPLPFARRQGILFVGNFWHPPNLDAVEFLCREIVPRLDSGLLARHPVYVVGNQLNDKVHRLGVGQPQVRMVGWVPSLAPYLQQVRVNVLPLRYGAGTKRKLLQALMTGTPTVSTRIGVEGLSAGAAEQVLVADGAPAFATAIERLLEDEAVWQQMAHRGREQVLPDYSREAARRRFQQVLEVVLAREPKRAMLPEGGPNKYPADLDDPYGQMINRIRAVVRDVVPAGERVLVISKGDDDLVRLDGRKGWHFPQTDKGAYAGYHPASSADAIRHLETLRAKGASYLLIPEPAFWWLEHYAQFRLHLESHFRLVARQEDCCLVYALREGDIPNAGSELRVGRQPDDGGEMIVRRDHRKKVLVLGIYLADVANHIDTIVAELAKSRRYDVTQCWVALRGRPATPRVADVTVRFRTASAPKFQILNELLAERDLAPYEYTLLVDDDITLPSRFLDRFLSLQTDLEFALAQPARTSSSSIDRPIVEQQQGVIARRTRFVEIGPVVSCHKSVYPILFPFDLVSGMGWGYENVWAYRLEQRDLKMGIIDVFPVEHTLRPPVAHYSWDKADKGRTALWEKHQHLSDDECFRVLDVIPFEEAVG